MRILLSLAALAASAGVAIAADTAGTWVPVVYNADGVGLVDVAHLQLKGGLTTVRMAVVLRAPDAAKPRSAAIALITEEVDCKAGTGRGMGNVILDLAGAELGRTPASGAMAPVDPTSNLGKMVTAACNPPSNPPESYPDVLSARKGVLAHLAAGGT